MRNHVVVEIERADTGGTRPGRWTVLDLDADVVHSGHDEEALTQHVRHRVVVVWRFAFLPDPDAPWLRAASDYIEIAAEVAVDSGANRLPRRRADLGDAFREAGTRAHAFETASEGGRYCSIDPGRGEDAAKWLQALWSLLSAGGVGTSTQARLRGRYAHVIAAGNRRGIPVSTAGLDALRTRGRRLVMSAAREVGGPHDLFDLGKLVPERAAKWSRSLGVEWPRSPEGHAVADLDYLDEVAGHVPKLRSLVRAARWAKLLSKKSLPAASDGLLRPQTIAMAARTGRDVLDPLHDIFTWPTGMRSLLAPTPGQTLLYIDITGMDLGVAAGLSRDPFLLEGYDHGDPYGFFAKALGVEDVGRKHVKAALLAAMYGAGAATLASTLGCSPKSAGRFLASLRRQASTFDKWQERQLVRGGSAKTLCTPLGWRWTPSTLARRSQLANFPFQATAADVVRLFAVECALNGLDLRGTVHDALVFVCPAAHAERYAATARLVLDGASRRALGGVGLQAKVTEVNVDRPWPVSADAQRFWASVNWDPPFLRRRKGLE